MQREEDKAGSLDEAILALRGFGAAACLFFAVGTVLTYSVLHSTAGALWTTAGMALSFWLAIRNYD